MNQNTWSSCVKIIGYYDQILNIRMLQINLHHFSIIITGPKLKKIFGKRWKSDFGSLVDFRVIEEVCCRVRVRGFEKWTYCVCSNCTNHCPSCRFGFWAVSCEAGRCNKSKFFTGKRSRESRVCIYSIASWYRVSYCSSSIETATWIPRISPWEVAFLFSKQYGYHQWSVLRAGLLVVIYRQGNLGFNR